MGPTGPRGGDGMDAPIYINVYDSEIIRNIPYFSFVSGRSGIFQDLKFTRINETIYLTFYRSNVTNNVVDSYLSEAIPVQFRPRSQCLSIITTNVQFGSSNNETIGYALLFTNGNIEFKTSIGNSFSNWRFSFSNTIVYDII